jgi:hypothetical protein
MTLTNAIAVEDSLKLSRSLSRQDARDFDDDEAEEEDCLRNLSGAICSATQPATW